jgi:lipopolysaccharide export system protein LptC
MAKPVRLVVSNPPSGETATSAHPPAANASPATSSSAAVPPTVLPHDAAPYGGKVDNLVFAPRRTPREPLLARYVPYLIIGLPVLALLVVMAGLIWPLISSDGGFRLGKAPVAPSDGAYMTMNNPQITGNDSKGRNFNLTAVSARQQNAQSSVLDLKSPKGDITLSGGNWVSLTADTGKFDQKQRQLDVAGNVQLFHDDGYQMTTEQAHIDLRQGTASGDKPVHSQGPQGVIDSQGFRVSGFGERIEFTGKANVTLYDGDQTLPDHKSDQDGTATGAGAAQ